MSEDTKQNPPVGDAAVVLREDFKPDPEAARAAVVATRTALAARRIVKSVKAKLRRAHRRADSLARKRESLAERSPDVRRWLAYEEADRRNCKVVEAYTVELAHFVLKLDE
jgi:hypothetical protein